MEVDFGQEAYETDFDSFMRYYLIVKTGDMPKYGEVYEAFKSYCPPETLASDVKVAVEDIRRFSSHYCAIALDAESKLELKLAFRDLRELKMDVAMPLLLELYDDYVSGTLQLEDFIETVRLMESYVFRRAVCSIPTNSLNKTFATFGRYLKKDRYLESIKAHFLLLPSYRRFPSDEEFKRDLQVRDLYNFRNRSYWLRRMENHNRKERVQVADYTIEHILPQNEDLPAPWKEELGPNWKEIQDTYVHTLGNLTLTGYNSEYSDRPYHEKCDMPGGFRESPLRLNHGLGQLEHWNEEAIRNRAEQLSDIALDVWRSPTLDPEILEAYKQRPTVSGTYAIEDHPTLLRSPSKELFQAFRQKVLELDPCVTEEFLKLYVAYKAESNFVDVVPQSKGLRLFLNMRFIDIDDPKGYCRDVSGVGRWGNGDVEVFLRTHEDLPYVMRLVRQSFESQIRDGEDL